MKERKIPRWALATGFVLALFAITYLLVQQRSQRRMLREGAFISVSPATERETDPRAAVMPDGAVAVAWSGIPKGAREADRLGVRLLPKGARAWGPIRAASIEGRSVSEPAIAAGANGDLWLAFLAGGEGRGARVFLAHGMVDSGDVSLEAPRAMSVEDAQATRATPSLALVAGAPVIAYREEKAGRARIVAGVETVAEGDVRWPAICASGARAYVAWVDAKAGVVLRAGAAAATPVSRPGEDLAGAPPSCAAEGDEVAVLYGIAAKPGDPESAGLLASAVVARSNDGGRTFSQRIEVREAGLVLQGVAMAREASGAIAIAYYAGRGEPHALGALRWTRIANIGDGAPPAREARAPIVMAPSPSDPRWLGERLGLAAGPGHLAVAFVDNADALAHVAFAELGP